jgi:cytochrome b subunit of formate dehydrogenase
MPMHGGWLTKQEKTPKGKVYEASETEHHLGELSVFIVVLWAIVFIGVGLIVIVRNYG